MSVILASAWHPRGELSRLRRLLPQLALAYNGLAVTMPPDADHHAVAGLHAALDAAGLPNRIMLTPDWSWGRHLALQHALDLPGQQVHYVDFDRLLRWVETRLDEWRQVVNQLAGIDCLLIGRTPLAYATHPQALVQTEAISNRVVSHILGFSVDVSAGSKGFSREAAGFLVTQCTPGRALGTDAIWPIRLQRAGFGVKYIEVDGLDWEIADQHRDTAANDLDQRLKAAEYDANPVHWAKRTAVAMEIVECALESAGNHISI